MSWRSVIIANPAKLSLAYSQMHINQEENEYSVPIEDIATIIIDNTHVTITNKLLSKLASYNIALYICDDSHLPTGIYTAFNQHSRQSKVLEQQFNLAKPFKKRCWQSIIQRKIENQARCLEILNCEGVDRLRAFIPQVNSGDSDNIEAITAKIYFDYLWGKDFKRFRHDIINIAMNYGYAIVRGAIARSLVMYGFYPAIGIHHHSELNNFNLADDLIEPFRPSVDLWVATNMGLGSIFNSEAKKALAELLYYEVIIDGKKHNYLQAINILVRSFSSAVSDGDYNKLILPELIGLKYHQYE